MKFSIILICFHILQFSRSEDYHQHLTEKFNSGNIVQKEPCHDYNTLKYSAPIHAIRIEEDPELDHTEHPSDVETNDEVQIDGLETHSSPHPPESHPLESHPPESHPPESHPPESHPPESHPSSDDEDIIEHPLDQAKESGSTPAEPHASSSNHVSGTPSSPIHPNPGPSKGGKDFHQPIGPHVGASEHGAAFYPGHPIPYYPHPAVHGSGLGFHPYYVGGASFGSSGYGKSYASSQPVTPVHPSTGYHAGGNSFDSSKGNEEISGASGNQPIFPVYPSGYYSGGHAFYPFQTSGSTSGASDYDKSFSSHQPGGRSYYSSKGSGSASGSSDNGKSFSSSQPVSPVYPSTGYYVGRHGFLPFEASGSASGASHQPVSPIYPSPGFHTGGNGFHVIHGMPPAPGASGYEKPFASGQPVSLVYPSQSGYSSTFYPTHASGSSSGASESGKSFSAPHPIPAYSHQAPPAEGKAIHSSYSTGGSNYGKNSYPAYPQLAIYSHPGVVYKPVFQPAHPKEPVASPNQQKTQYDSYGHEIKFGGPFYPGQSSYAPSFHFFQPPSFTPGPRYPTPPKNGPSFNPPSYQPKGQALYPGLPYSPKPEPSFRILPYPPVYGYPYLPQAPKNGRGFQPQPQPPKQTPSYRPPQSKPVPPSYNYGGQSNDKGYEYQYFQPGKSYSYQHRTQYNYNAPQLPVGFQQGLEKSYGVQNTKAVEGFHRAFYPGPYYNAHYPPYFQHQPKTFVYYIFLEDVKPVVEYNDHHHPELPARLRFPKDQNVGEDRSQSKSKRKDLHEPESTTAEIRDVPPEQLKVKPHPKPLTPEQIKLIIDLAHSKAMDHHVKDSESPPAVSTQFFTRVYPSPKNATHMEMKEETFDE